MKTPPIFPRSSAPPDRAWYERFAPHEISQPFTPGMYEGKSLSEVEAMIGTSPSLSPGGCQSWDTFNPEGRL